MARRFTGPRVVRGKRRMTQWTATVPEATFSALGAAAAVIDSTFVTDVNNPETIVRVRGLLSVMSDQIAASERPFGAFGMAVVSDQAVAAGVASVPTPYQEADSDFWFVHQFFAGAVQFASSVGLWGGSSVITQYVIESKAMRKVSPDQTVIAVLDNGNTSDGLLYRLDLRMLSKVA